MELLERASHLTQLDEHLELAAAGHGRVVFVGGEAGVGKTSLINAFCQRASGAAQVLWKSCDALSTPGPLGSLRDMAPALGLRIDREVAGREGRDWLFRAALNALADRPEATIVVGEDAHWADGATLELVRFLARRIATSGLSSSSRIETTRLAPPTRCGCSSVTWQPNPPALPVQVRALSKAGGRGLQESSGL